MKHLKFVEHASTKYFGVTAAVLVVGTVASYGVVAYWNVDAVKSVATLSDAIFKTVAVLVGSLWAANRYFVARPDEPQFRVDADVSVVRMDSWNPHALLNFRLDLVNTGKVQIAQFDHYLVIEEVEPNADGNEAGFRPLHRWPQAGTHPGGPIEPGSWSAVNGSVSCKASVGVVRVFIGVVLGDGQKWTWHKTVDVSNRRTTA